MKKAIFTTLIFTISLFFTNTLSAQKFSNLDKSPLDVVAFPKGHKQSQKTIKIYYSRPQLKGRTVESLAPAGKVWRTGANEAVEVILTETVDFGGEKVKPGTYSLYTIPGEKEWTIILNSATNAWGAYSYDKADDVIRVKGKVSKSEAVIEAFSIAFDAKMTLCLGWGNTIVKVPVSK